MRRSLPAIAAAGMIGAYCTGCGGDEKKVEVPQPNRFDSVSVYNLGYNDAIAEAEIYFKKFQETADSLKDMRGENAYLGKISSARADTIREFEKRAKEWRAREDYYNENMKTISQRTAELGYVVDTLRRTIKEREGSIDVLVERMPELIYSVDSAIVEEANEPVGKYNSVFIHRKGISSLAGHNGYEMREVTMDDLSRYYEESPLQKSKRNQLAAKVLSKVDKLDKNPLVLGIAYNLVVEEAENSNRFFRTPHAETPGFIDSLRAWLDQK